MRKKAGVRTDQDHNKVDSSHALYDTRLMDDLVIATKSSAYLNLKIGLEGTANRDA